MNYKKSIVRLYSDSLGKNLADIERTLKDRKIYSQSFFNNYEKLLNNSSKQVSERWSRGDKYLRTEFMLEAFSDSYPRKHLDLSISIDAMINILDDLLDKELDREQKASYILEYLRVFSLYSLNQPNAQIQKSMSLYFNKLISLAIAESVYLKTISKEKTLKQMVNQSVNLLLTRSLDVDIFIEIATVKINDKKEKQLLKESARIFRAFNIFKKDIFDIKQDKKQGQDTLVTYMYDHKKKMFEDYIREISTQLLDKITEVENKANNLKMKNEKPVKRFIKMLNRDVRELEKYISQHLSQ